MGGVSRSGCRFRWGVIALVLAASGCSAGTPSSDLPSAIGCETLMRPTTGSAEGERASSLTVPLASSQAAEPEVLDLGEFQLAVRYGGDSDEGRVVMITVSTPSGELLSRDLYQLSDGAALRNDFAGGHGFTGLKYVYSGSAELQVTCTAPE